MRWCKIWSWKHHYRLLRTLQGLIWVSKCNNETVRYCLQLVNHTIFAPGISKEQLWLLPGLQSWRILIGPSDNEYIYSSWWSFLCYKPCALWKHMFFWLTCFFFLCSQCLFTVWIIKLLDLYCACIHLSLIVSLFTSYNKQSSTMF